MAFKIDKMGNMIPQMTRPDSMGNMPRPMPMQPSSTAVASPVMLPQPDKYTDEQRQADTAFGLQVRADERSHELQYADAAAPVLTNKSQINSPERRKAFAPRRPIGNGRSQGGDYGYSR